MLLLVVRFFFLVVFVAVLLSSLLNSNKDSALIDDPQRIASALLALGGALLVLAVDVFTPKKKLSVLAGVFFGLIVGVLFSWGAGYIIEMISFLYDDVFHTTPQMLLMTKLLTGVCICYLTVSVVVRTKDDVRFVVPYVEFARQSKGLRPLVLDSSVIVDGRISDLTQTKIFDAPFVVPRFILNELQLLSDSADKLKRSRGRRGLDMLASLQADPIVEVQIDDTPPPGVDDRAPVDQKLVAFSKQCNGRLVTTDYNLGKVALLREVDVVNINDIAKALKPVVLPGEDLEVKILKKGEEMTQGIGYLDDGTMVVVENANNQIGNSIKITITSSLQTSAGRMIFGKYGNGPVDQSVAEVKKPSSGNNYKNSGRR